MGVAFEVKSDGLVARLEGLERAFSPAELIEPLTEVGAFLLQRFWDRIAGQRTSVYSERYVRWLKAQNYWSGKLVGVLSGALIGSGAPGASLSSEPEDPGRVQVVGFLDPGQAGKARAFARWYASKFGVGPMEVTADDADGVGAIFDRWQERVVSGER